MGDHLYVFISFVLLELLCPRGLSYVLFCFEDDVVLCSLFTSSSIWMLMLFGFLFIEFNLLSFFLCLSIIHSPWEPMGNSKSLSLWVLNLLNARSL